MPLDGQWPPVHASDYVPLILSLSDFNSEEIANKKINKILKGDIDDMSNNLIKFEDIFQSDGDENVNSILVQGSPGIGKTVFSLTVCKKWAAGKYFTQFEVVILWALRDPQIEKFTSVEDLFFHDSEEVSAAVVREVKQTGGKGVLFLFDGWDELPAKFVKSRSSCFFLKLIEGSELPFSSVIVTSRNISSQRLLRQNLFNRTIDILGFSKECIQEYIYKCFSKSPEDGKQLLKLLSERSDLQSICYIPMNCSIVSYVFSCKHTLPSTLTELYSLLAKNSLIRNVDLRSKELTESDFDHLPEEINDLYLSLCKLSYHGLAISRYTYSREDVAAACQASSGIVVDVDKLGVLQAVNVFHSEGVSLNFHFLHTTLQEFMAANYIASLNQRDLETVVNSHFSHMTFKVVWQFYSGLLAKDSQLIKNTFIEYLQREAKTAADIDSGFHDTFSYCSSDDNFSDSDSDYFLEEDEEVIEEDEEITEEFQDLAKPINNESELLLQAPDDINTQQPAATPKTELTSNSAEAQSSALTLKDEDTFPICPNPSLSLSPPSTTLAVPSSKILVTTGGLEGVPTTLSSLSATFVSSVDPYKRDKSQILFTLCCVYETQNRLLCASLHNKLSSNLYFKKFSLSPAEVNAIGFAIARSNRKWQLHLVNCDVDINLLALLCHHFLKSSCTGKLTRLYLNDNDLDFACAKLLAKMLPVLKSLQKLFLGSNNLCDESFENGAIPELLRGLLSIKCIDLASNKLSDLAVDCLKDSLIHHRHLTHLDISHNSISSVGAEVLGSTLCHTTLTHLNIGGNPLEDMGIENLSQYLADSKIEFLNISDTSMTDEGLVVLATVLQLDSSLHILIMHSNNEITHEGLSSFLDISSHSQLCEIDISYCQTGWSDSLLDVFTNNIPIFKTLKILDLSYNCLEDEGISTLLNSISHDSHIMKLAIGGNGVSSSCLQMLGCVVCENTTLKKINLDEEDLACDTDDFDTFCECLIASTSLQVIEINAVENEQLLRRKFREINAQREIYGKNKVKIYYFQAGLN